MPLVDPFRRDAEKEDPENPDELLDTDDDGYPRLPVDVLEFRLSRKKTMIRLFIGALRRMSLILIYIYLYIANVVHAGYFKLTGRIPWGDMAEHPSRYLSAKSRPDSDHKLMEPSHMKAKGVDDWLNHWLKLQKKGKQRVTLKDPSVVSSDNQKHTNERTLQNGDRHAKGKKKASPSLEPSDGEDISRDTENTPEIASVDGDNLPSDNNDGVEERAKMPGLPTAPSAAATSEKTRLLFLMSLSDDKNYRQLILLLRAAKASHPHYF
jgi:hypothetical protein